MRRLLALLALAFIAVIAAPEVSAPPPLLAPLGACPEDGKRAAECLIRYARVQAHRPPLYRSKLLAMAAEEKAAAIVACDQFSHTPCGQSANRVVLATGYRPLRWAENLYLGTGEARVAREAVRQWLESASHRVNLLARGFDELGVAVRHDALLAGDVDVAVWVLELGRN
jgi:uncharacterized protein YkwD